ncbi:MAG: saccharopine dehydrogenase, partial [Bacteroidetes bacterium]|nr:saccharopine dehydrogenase [Bacteroidota bacterium]
AYYNRNSLKYIEAYGLNQVESVIRYTLRRKDFCEAWNAFVELGMTDNLFEFNFAAPITHRDFTRMFIRTGSGSLEERFAKAIGKSTDHPVMQKLQWLGIFNSEPLQMQSGTSAKFLQKIIEKKWTIEAHERDAIYMAHVCYYELNNELFKRKSYLAVEGDDYHKTAMAKTVGLPLAIAVSEFLKGNISAKGVQIPCGKIFYEPILKALELEGIAFDEVLEKK